MASYVKFKLADGTIVYVETTETPRGSSGLLPPKTGAHEEQESISFEKAVDTIGKMSAAMVQDLRAGFAEPPDDVSVSFGLKASGDVGGLVVARGGMEANYNVSLRWHRDDKKEKEDEKDEKKAE